MFGTLLLATIVGTGVGNAAIVPAVGLDARSNSPPSYLCSANQNKCSKQKNSVTAYCSSYLSIPKVTRTICSTTTKTTTSFTTTITKPASVETKLITNCALPASTPAPTIPEEGSDGGDAAAPAPEGRSVEIDERNAAPAVYKPDCLSSYKDRSAITSACKCFSIKPYTTTKTDLKTTTKTIKTATTVKGTPSTTYVLPTNFLIANNRGNFLNAECLTVDKDVESGRRSARLYFDEDPSDAILFALNGNNTTPSALEGAPGALFEFDSQGDDIIAEELQVFSGTVSETQPRDQLTCSISYVPETGTCPLKCQARSAQDTNQGAGDDDWILGPPNTVDERTYDTFAVSRSGDQIGSCTRRARGGKISTVGRNRR